MLVSVWLLVGCEEEAEIDFLAWSPDGAYVGYVMDGDELRAAAGFSSFF